MTSRAGEGATGGGGEVSKFREMCRHSVVPRAWFAMDLKMDSWGSKKEPPRGEISTPGGSEMAILRPLEASRGVLGGRSGSGGRSWRKKVALVFLETAKK